MASHDTNTRKNKSNYVIDDTHTRRLTKCCCILNYMIILLYSVMVLSYMLQRFLFSTKVLFTISQLSSQPLLAKLITPSPKAAARLDRIQMEMSFKVAFSTQKLQIGFRSLVIEHRMLWSNTVHLIVDIFSWNQWIRFFFVKLLLWFPERMQQVLNYTQQHSFEMRTKTRSRFRREKSTFFTSNHCVY